MSPCLSPRYHVSHYRNKYFLLLLLLLERESVPLVILSRPQNCHIVVSGGCDDEPGWIEIGSQCYKKVINPKIRKNEYSGKCQEMGGNYHLSISSSCTANLYLLPRLLIWGVNLGSNMRLRGLIFKRMGDVEKNPPCGMSRNAAHC